MCQLELRTVSWPIDTSIDTILVLADTFIPFRPMLQNAVPTYDQSGGAGLLSNRMLAVNVIVSECPRPSPRMGTLQSRYRLHTVLKVSNCLKVFKMHPFRKLEIAIVKNLAVRNHSRSQTAWTHSC